VVPKLHRYAAYGVGDWSLGGLIPFVDVFFFAFIGFILPSISTIVNVVDEPLLQLLRVFYTDMVSGSLLGDGNWP
jgi:hypothetical protein